MKAIVLDDSVPLPRLELRELDAPKPGSGDLLIRVAAAGLNRADLTAPRKTGHAVHPLGIPGSELAGHVVGLGDDVVGFAIGERVMALATGSYAEFACVDHRLAMHVPDAIDLTTAASLPVWYMTAHDAVVTQGRLRPGDTVLIQGATSGVGMAAAQLARYFGASTVIGVARSAEKLRRLEGPMIDCGIASDEDWTARVQDLTDGRGADLIIDMVGAGALAGNLACAAIAGRIVAVGRLGGPADTLDINMLALKRLSLIGVSFRMRTLAERAAIARAFVKDVLPAIVAGKLSPMVDRIFPLADAVAAQNYMRSNAHIGKILLEIA